MKFWEQRAIELRYQGKTNRQIADEVSKLVRLTLTASTIAKLFMVGGRLYVDNLTYEAQQNKWSQEHSRQENKRLSAHTGKYRNIILKKALETGDYRLALDVIKDIDDRAGNVVVRKTEVKEEPKAIQTYEDYVTECERLGVDPKTGIPAGAEKMGAN